jgi:hypothetical protein
MRRLATLLAVLFAVLLGATATAVPSYAATGPTVLPDCATALPGSGSGISSSCSTQGPPPVECNGCGVLRTVDVVVTVGGADATLLCDGRSTATHVDGPGTRSFSIWGGLNCTLTLTATADGTAAAATSTASYVFATA